MHQVGDSATGNNLTWASTDQANFQVFAVRDEITSPNVKFVLTGTAGGHVPALTTSVYEDVYSKTRWNLSVKRH